MKLTTVFLSLVLLGSTIAWRVSASDDAAIVIAFPEGYRDWTHVKSALVGPEHKRFATNGGFQHIYANAAAMIGYRTGTFPEGSIIVFDTLEPLEDAGRFTEGPRRRVDVMMKDAQRFAATGGWGFQRYAGDSRTELATELTPQQCFACHDRLKKNDLVLSVYRP